MLIHNGMEFLVKVMVFQNSKGRVVKDSLVVLVWDEALFQSLGTDREGKCVISCGYDSVW